MAIYHCSIKIHSRGKGQSAIAAIAYRAGEKIECERTGDVSDYSYKRGVEYSEIMLPEHVERTHPEFYDRAVLWNAVDAVEKQATAQFSREWEVALPKELTVDQMKDVVRDFCSGLVAQGMIVDWSLHQPHDVKNEDQNIVESNENWHAHISAPTRGMDENGQWMKKESKTYALDKDGNRIPEIDPQTGKQKVRVREGKGAEKLWKRETVASNEWNRKENAVEWRKQWERAVNRGLEKAGRTERVDCRSLEDQGIERVPQVHEGPAARQIEKKMEEQPDKAIKPLAVDQNKMLQMFLQLRETLRILHQTFKEEKRQKELHQTELEIRRSNRATHRIETKGATRHTINILTRVRNTTAELMTGIIRALEQEKQQLHEQQNAEREAQIRERLERLRSARAVNAADGRNAEGNGREGSADTDSLIRQAEAERRAAERDAAGAEAERQDRDAQRERQAAAERAKKAAERERAARAERQRQSRDRGWER